MEDKPDGPSLWALGLIAEGHLGVKRSADLFERALRLLDGHTPELMPLRADCLHGRARKVNQIKVPARSTEAARKEYFKLVELALTWMQEAERLRQDDPENLARHQALSALLLQRSAQAHEDGSAEQFEVLQRARDALDESWCKRAEVLSKEHPALDRGLYNRAGVRVDLARLEPERALEYIQTAEQVYDETLRFRRRLYGPVASLTAAALNGLAITDYYQALLKPEHADDLLCSALERALAAANARRQLASGDDQDVGKSLALVIKIASARLARSSENGRALVGEAYEEFLREDLVE